MSAGEGQRVTILGANSLVARHLVRRLLAEGYIVACQSRGPRPADADPSVEWLSFDITAPGQVPLEPCGVVISLLRIPLLARFLGRLPRFEQLIAFGTTSEISKFASRDPKEHRDAEEFHWAGETLRTVCAELDRPLTILRPTLIYGEGQGENVAFIAQCLRRFRVFPIAAPGLGRRQPVHADDLAAAAVAAIGNPRAYDQTLDLPGGETLTYRDMVARIAETVPHRSFAPRLPVWLYAMLVAVLAPRRFSPAMVHRMNEDLTFDMTPAQVALDYRPRKFDPAG